MSAISSFTPADSSFTQPTTVEYLPLCRDTGLMATDDCPDTALYPVNNTLLPAECDEHGGGWLFGW